MSDITETADGRLITSPAPARGLLARLAKGVAQVRARVRDSARRLIESAVRRLREKIRPSVGLVKSLFMATIGKDRGFGFWWLMAMAAIALIIGVLVAVVLSPVLGIIAALVVAIWMLVRRRRSSGSREPDPALA